MKNWDTTMFFIYWLRVQHMQGSGLHNFKKLERM